MSWNGARASTWMKKYADDLAGDAYKHSDMDWAWACAGAAYFAVIRGIGYNTQREFEDFLRDHIKLDELFIAEAVEEITT